MEGCKGRNVGRESSMRRGRGAVSKNTPQAVIVKDFESLEIFNTHMLAVLPAKSSATSSTRCRLRTGAGSGVVS